jgi:hypothetical protein
MGCWINTSPDDYAVDLSARMTQSSPGLGTPSSQVIRALQENRAGVKTHGFRRSVLEAIFEDGFRAYFSNSDYAARVRGRLERFYGRANTQRVLCNCCEVLRCWWYDDPRFIPDAYLVDSDNHTIVCYEVEDYHPLTPHSILRYAGSWYTLDQIYWDLHLVAYDIYGNPRVVDIPRAHLTAGRLAKSRRKRL